MKKARRRKTPVVLVEVENGVVVATRVLNGRVHVLVVDWDSMDEHVADYARTHLVHELAEADPKTATDLRRRLAAYVRQP